MEGDNEVLDTSFKLVEIDKFPGSGIPFSVSFGSVILFGDLGDATSRLFAGRLLNESYLILSLSSLFPSSC